MNQDDSFAPIERLMEFGMSMAVANQMIQTMNDVLAKSNKPSGFKLQENSDIS